MEPIKLVLAAAAALLLLPVSADNIRADHLSDPPAAGTLQISCGFTGEYGIVMKPLGEDTVRVMWEPMEGADSYALAFIGENGKKISYLKNNKTHCRISGLKKGGSYRLRLYGKLSGTHEYITMSKDITLNLEPETPLKFAAPDYSTDTAVLEWEAVKCTGYEIERFRDGKWKSSADFADPAKKSCTLSSLTPGELYKFRIRAYSGEGKNKVYSGYKETEFMTDKEKMPESVEVSGANMVYVGESFCFKYTYSDGKDYAGHTVSWTAEPSELARTDENGRLTALSKGDVTLTFTDETARISGSMVVHCVESAADVNFVPEIFGVPIANKTYPLPADYDPGMNAEALAAFGRMSADAAKEGLSLNIVSGYRTYARQQQLYSYWTAIFGADYANKVSARPGFSEHQLGLAMDINDCYYSFLDTPECGWLARNCHRYGFIIRYPSHETESITGYAYEPWHIRYLGEELAGALYESGLTLEEYLGIDSYYR